MNALTGQPQLVTVGTTIHTSTCWHARRPDVTPQSLAVTTSAALAIAAVDAGLQPCKKCKPISRLAWWERSHR